MNSEFTKDFIIDTTLSKGSHIVCKIESIKQVVVMFKNIGDMGMIFGNTQQHEKEEDCYKKSRRSI